MSRCVPVCPGVSRCVPVCRGVPVSRCPGVPVSRCPGVLSALPRKTRRCPLAQAKLRVRTSEAPRGRPRVFVSKSAPRLIRWQKHQERPGGIAGVADQPPWLRRRFGSAHSLDTPMSPDAKPWLACQPRPPFWSPARARRWACTKRQRSKRAPSAACEARAGTKGSARLSEGGGRARGRAALQPQSRCV